MVAVSKANLQQPTYTSTSWNTPLNSNFGIITNALGSVTGVSVTTTDYAMSTAEAQSAVISVSGTLTGARSLLLPVNVSGTWIILNNTSSNTLSVYSNNGSGAAAGVGVSPPTGYAYTIWSDGTNVYYGESNAVRKSGDTMVGALALPSNGLNVGSGQLQVSGGNVTTTGQFTASNNVTAYSDARLKEAISPISSALEKVLAMRGVTFSYIDTGARGAGVIAQEVQKALPEVVYEDEDGYLHVAYGNMVSVLIEAIKELSIKVESLENRK